MSQRDLIQVFKNNPGKIFGLIEVKGMGFSNVGVKLRCLLRSKHVEIVPAARKTLYRLRPEET